MDLVPFFAPPASTGDALRLRVPLVTIAPDRFSPPHPYRWPERPARSSVPRGSLAPVLPTSLDTAEFRKGCSRCTSLVAPRRTRAGACELLTPRGSDMR